MKKLPMVKGLKIRPNIGPRFSVKLRFAETIPKKEIKSTHFGMERE